MTEPNEIVFDQWSKLVSGLPVEYHKRLADRVVACLGNWIPEEHLEDALNDMRYHRRQIESLLVEDTQRPRHR